MNLLLIGKLQISGSSLIYQGEQCSEDISTEINKRQVPSPDAGIRFQRLNKGI